MLLDLLDPNNQATYNIKLAQVAGLEAAVYINQLIIIQNKAMKKEKLYNGYFKLNREFITKQTSLTTTQQTKLDGDLINLHILVNDSNDPTLLKLDLDVLSSIIANDDVSLKSDLSKITKTNKKAVKEMQQNAIIKNLKLSIHCSDETINEALRGWVDAIYAGPKPYLSKAAIIAFQRTLCSYTDDVDVALKIVEIATSSFLTNCQWAINTYEQDKTRKRKIEVQDGVVSKTPTGKSSGVVF